MPALWVAWAMHCNGSRWMYLGFYFNPAGGLDANLLMVDSRNLRFYRATKLQGSSCFLRMVNGNHPAWEFGNIQEKGLQYAAWLGNQKKYVFMSGRPCPSSATLMFGRTHNSLGWGWQHGKKVIIGEGLGSPGCRGLEVIKSPGSLLGSQQKGDSFLATNRDECCFEEGITLNVSRAPTSSRQVSACIKT